MNERHGRPWPSYLLGLAAIGAIVAAYLVVGPPSETTASETRIVTAQRGVVQSTVSGSGNVEAAKQLDLGFKTSGVVHRIYVSQGQHVVEGQLLAELDPGSAEVTLEQARATLKTAEATLAKEEETDGEGSSTGSGTAGRTGAAAASVENATLAYEPGGGTATSGTPANGQESSTHEQAKTETSATEAPASGSGAPSSSRGTSPPSTSSNDTSGGGSSSSSSPSNSKDSSHGSNSEKSLSTTPSTTTSPTSSSDTKLSSAAKAANIASASAAVKSDKLAVQSDEQALANTKLYAPETGTLVSLSGEVGETVSATGTTKAASSSGSEGTGSSSSSGAAAALGGGTGSSGNSGSGSSDSSSSSFAVLSDLSSMQLVVSIGESEIGEIKEGQPATVTIEALEGRKLAAEVTAISTLPTSTSDVVSYDVTFALSQLTEGLKPGMSATAEVVVKQAEGVNLPTSAVTGGTVTVLQSGKQVRRSVVTGLAGNSSTIVISGLKAGEQVVLPAARSSSSASSSLLSRLGSRLGGGGLGGGGFGGGGALRRAGGFAAGPLGG